VAYKAEVELISLLSPIRGLLDDYRRATRIKKPLATAIRCRKLLPRVAAMENLSGPASFDIFNIRHVTVARGCSSVSYFAVNKSSIGHLVFDHYLALTNL